MLLFKEYSRNRYCLNKSNLQMSNIEYLRQLHRKKLKLKRTQFGVKEFYSYEKDLVLGCVKDLIFKYYVHEKNLDFGRFIMPGNKLLPRVIFINDLNRSAFCENEA